MEPDQVINRFGLSFTPEVIEMVQAGQVMVSVPREEIVHLAIQRGSHAERPLIQAAFSVLMIFMGLAPIAAFLDIAIGDLPLKAGSMVAFLPFGCWGLWSALARGFFILVDLKNDRRKLPIDLGTSLVEIRQLIQDVERSFGYSIEWRDS